VSFQSSVIGECLPVGISGDAQGRPLDTGVRCFSPDSRAASDRPHKD
jgi:hypothetical protein